MFEKNAAVVPHSTQYFGGFILQVLRVLAVFWGSVLLQILLRILSGSHYFGALATAAVVDTACCAASISGFCATGTASNIIYIPGSLLALFRSLVTFVILLLQALAVNSEIPSICPVYTSSMTCTSTVCAPCRQIIRPIVWHIALPDSPTSGSWSKLFSLGTTRVLRAMTVFWDVIHCEEYCFDTAGTYLPVLSGFGPAHNLTLSIWAFSVLVIYFGRQYS